MSNTNKWDTKEFEERVAEMRARTRRVEETYTRVAEGRWEGVTIHAMREMFGTWQHVYCGQFTDGHGTVEDFQWSCRERMRRNGVKPSPRAWVETAISIMPAGYVFDP